MKKYYVTGIIAISFLPLVAIFLRSELFHTHDGFVHLSRMAAYYDSFSHGQILPRWANNLNFGYGLPLFNFIYHTPYLLSVLGIFFGLSLTLTFKIICALSFILSGIFMYLWAETFFKNEKIAFIVTLFYQFSPFRLVELLVRGSYGELYTYAILPLVLYSIERYNEKQTVPRFILLSAFTAVLVISHNSISLVYFGICFLYSLIFSGNNRSRLLVMTGLTMGLLLSAFYWIPALIEHKYTYGNLFMKDMYKSHFPPLMNFFIPNLFNVSSLQTGGISVQIGLFHTIAIITGLFAVFRVKTRRLQSMLIFSLFLILLALFFMQPISSVIWERVSLLRQFQFPWRLLSVISFGSAVTAYVLVPRKNLTLLFFLSFLVVFSTAFYWYPPLGFDQKTDEKETYWNYPLNTTYFGETDVIWSEGPAKQYPKHRIEIIEGSAVISNYNKNGHVHSFDTMSSESAKLVANIQYFPGWKVFVDRVKTPIEFQNQLYRGLITFPVSPGNHHIVISFKQSALQRFSDIVSCMSILGIIVLYIMFYKNQKNRNS